MQKFGKLRLTLGGIQLETTMFVLRINLLTGHGGTATVRRGSLGLCPGSVGLAYKPREVAGNQRIQCSGILDLVAVQLHAINFRPGATDGNVKILALDALAFKVRPDSLFLGCSCVFRFDFALVVVEFLLECLVLLGILDIGRLGFGIFLRLFLGVSVPCFDMCIDQPIDKILGQIDLAFLCELADMFSRERHLQ